MKVGPVLTPEDIDPLVAAGKLSKSDNIGWRNVTYTQLSIARHYGGTNVNGVHYTYIPESDELVRDDVLKMVMKARADALKKPAKEAAPDLLSLPETPVNSVKPRGRKSGKGRSSTALPMKDHADD